MTQPIATVFGGSGFLGRHLVEQLAAAGFAVRVAARHPERVSFPALPQPVTPVAVDIRDERAVAGAVEDAQAVINAVALWVERGDVTFEAIHIDGAERVARCAAQAGVARLVHISGLGVDTQSPSAFIRARARGEQAVNALFPQATVLRPSVMFGPDDAFLSSLELATRFPVVPLFGRGETRLQPAHVADVAAAAARICAQPAREAERYELGGSQVLTYREAVAAVMRHLDRHRLLLPVPFPLWKAGAAALSVLPNPPLTRDQIQLLEKDNVIASGAPSFADLNLQPRGFEQSLDELLPR